MGFVLNCIYLMALIVASPWMLWRAIRTGRYREGWSEKLWGQVPVRDGSAGCVWMHAVSVGEVQLLRTIVAEWERQQPSTQIVISTTTKTGMELARKLFPKHTVCYCPMDFTWAVRRSLARLRPSLLVLVELELWPNLVRLARRADCPVAIINGRLSEKSFRGYRRFRWLIGGVLRQMAWIGAQDATYWQRFVDLGANPESCEVTGSMKFDGAESDRGHSEIVERRRAVGLREDDLVWVAGSTQEPEEQALVDAFQKLAAKHAQLKLVIVPRHPERFDQVSKLIFDSGLVCFRRSSMLPVVGSESSKSSDRPAATNRASAVPDDWRIMLGDTIGELRWWWGLADIGFVGGSFGDRGGQNMIEPAAFGVAVAVGPNTWNFRDIVELLRKADGLEILQEPEQLYDWVDRMLRNPELARQMGQRASMLVGQHRGATQLTVERLMRLMDTVQKRSKAA